MLSLQIYCVWRAKQVSALLLAASAPHAAAAAAAAAAAKACMPSASCCSALPHQDIPHIEKVVGNGS